LLLKACVMTRFVSMAAIAGERTTAVQHSSCSGMLTVTACALVPPPPPLLAVTPCLSCLHHQAHTTDDLQLNSGSPSYIVHVTALPVFVTVTTTTTTPLWRGCRQAILITQCHHPTVILIPRSMHACTQTSPSFLCSHPRVCTSAADCFVNCLQASQSPDAASQP
jgi:hypothetical protein